MRKTPPFCESRARDWALALQRYEIPFLHMSALDWKNEKLVAGLDEFARIVRKHALYGFSVAVDAKYYRSMPGEKKRSSETKIRATLRFTGF